MDQPIQPSQVPNFRDVGQTVNRFLGRKLVREGIFYRSARPDGASPQDQTLMRDRLGIKTIIDLRTRTELRQQADKQQQRQRKQQRQLDEPEPSESSFGTSLSCHQSSSPSSSSTALSSNKSPPFGWSTSSSHIQGVRYVPVNIIGPPVERFLMSQLTWWAFTKTVFLFLLGYRLQVTRIMASEVLVPMGLLGLSKVVLDRAAAEIRQVLCLFTYAPSMPALVHCTQGKDRTGLVCALILHVLGVPSSAIEHDYFLTDAALLHDRADMLFEVRNSGFTDEWAGTDENMISGTEQHLHTVYGGIDAYLDHISFGAEERASLRKALLY